MWAIRQDLRLAEGKEWMAIILESECQYAINWITEENKEENHPCMTLIEDCKNLIKEVSLTIQFVLREANMCSNKMACLGRSQHEKLVKVLVPPIELVEDLTTDLEGSSCFPKRLLVAVLFSMLIKKRKHATH